MRARLAWAGAQNRGLWFVAPALFLLVVFFALPVLGALLLSLTDFDIYAIADLDTLRFVGARNYVRLVQDPLFWIALKNTAYFAVVGGPLSVAVSLAAALLLNHKLTRARTILRTALFLPVITTLVAVAVVWRAIYHPRFGILNHTLALFGIDAIDWLGDPRWAMPALILMAVWKSFGFNMIIFMAGLQSIPERLYEAARVDGARGLQQLRHVTLPMLVPTFVFVGVTTAIGYLQLFAEPYVMTQGGPSHSTLSVVLFMYEQGFRWWNLGYAAATAFVLFAIIAALTALALRGRSVGGDAAAVEGPRR